ncbi:FtsK-like DNA translocase [Bacillus phage 268TH004]|uniref:FtsK-like DNA translocase n=1 Tax=Bacillus phage 268TH004 TaxID=2801523 RepID=A0A7T7ZAS8_9CAUD|nr:FtsK-like DNA translocase [Bacillus phage 268TH004]
MIFEAVSTVVMGGIALQAYLSKNSTSNDSQKIQKIFSLSGLNVRDDGKTLTAQLVKKKAHPWGHEYKFRIPLGRSFEDYKAKLPALEDGLNNRRGKVNVKDLKELKLDKDILNSIKQLWQKKLTERKELELSYDGLLTVRVYNEPMPTQVPFQAGSEWKVPVGVTREKNTFKYHDFEKVPHLALGGATRYGKSNFINSLICSLLTSKPDHTKLYLIDLKGGVELCDYENITQTASIAYEPEEALKTLEKAYNAMRELQSSLRSKGKKNVQEAGIKERHFIIIDEVGELNPAEAVTKEERQIKEQCQRYMSQIARLGAGLGFRQILATQYPTGDVIPRQCKQNSDGKLCFRVQSEVASRVVLDSTGAELLPEIKGRALYQTADKRVTIQTPLINSEVINQVTEPYIVKGVSKRESIEAIEPESRADSVIIEEI